MKNEESEQKAPYGNYYYYNNGAPAPLPQSQGEGSSFSIKEWAFRFLGYWYLFVICIFIALCLGFVKNRSWMPQYTTECKVLVDENTNGLNFMQNFAGGMDYASVNNQLLIIGSYNVISRAVQQLPLSIDFYNQGRFKTASLYGREPVRIIQSEISPDAYAFSFRFTPVNTTTFKIDIEDVGNANLRSFADNFKTITGHYGEKIECALFSIVVEKLYLLPQQKDFFFRFRSLRSLEDEFSARLSLGYMGSSRDPSTVISAELTSDDPLRDQDFLNALCKEFLASNLEEKNEEAIRTIEFIDEQLFLLSDSLNTSEAQLRQYRAVNNLVDISSYSSQIVAKLNALDQHRSELNLKAAYFDDLTKYLTQTVTDEKLVAPSSIGVADPTLLELVSQFNELQQRRSDLGEKNPQYTRLTKRMSEIKETMLEVLKNVRKVYNMERAQFEREYAQTMGEVKNLPDKEFEMVNYERKYKVNDNYYTFLLQKKSEAQIRKASNVPDNRILQESRTTLLPVNTRDKWMVYLIFLILGIVLPAVYVLLRYLLDNNINVEEDITRITKVPVLGNVLHSDSTARVESTKNMRSVFTEKFRILRSRIEVIVQRKANIMVAITSAESGDGKSYFSLNLAGTYSMLSKRVLLMDVDLRNPTLSRKCGYGNSKGLVHVLIGEAQLDDVIIRGDEEFGYDFLPSGVVPLNSAELVRSEKMNEIVEQLRKMYDYIVVDTSPLGLVSDAVDMMRRSDISIIVARAMKTNKNFFRNFMDGLELDDVHNMYIVLNDIPTVKRRKGIAAIFSKIGNGADKYSYGYGYGYYGHNSKYYNEEADKYYTSEGHHHKKNNDKE